MANDREILREIWEGKIPVCFQIDKEEVSYHFHYICFFYASDESIKFSVDF
jgi:hypothetical protein